MKFLTCLILSVFTTVADYTFRTQCSVEVNAPADAADKVIDQLIYDFQYDFEHLFDWAFFGLGKQNNDAHDALLLQSKNIIYEPEKEFGSITLDVIVANSMTLRNITIQGVIQDKRGQQGFAPTSRVDALTMEQISTWSRHIYIRANPNSFIFNQAFGNLYIIPIDESRSIYFMDINFCFAWYLRLFVTSRIYRNTIQWRVKHYMNNLKRAAEEPDFMK